jgi:ligand-binding sensor domain-containing protein
LLWIGTTKGLYTFREADKKFSLYDVEKQVGIRNRKLQVTDIAEDAGGNLWFTSYIHGLFRVDAQSKKCTVYSDNLRVSGLTRILVGPGPSMYVMAKTTASPAWI